MEGMEKLSRIEIGAHRKPKWKSAQHQDGERSGLQIGAHREEAGENETLYSLQRKLNASSKGGAFSSGQDNSKYFNQVDEAITSILGVMNEQFSGDADADWEVTKTVSQNYDKLITACQKYCGRKSFTAKGRARQEIVERICAQAMKDKSELTEYFGKMPGLLPKDRAKTVKEALASGRIRTLQLPEKHKHLGGAASDVIMFQSGEIEDGVSVMKNVYFKGEESFQGVQTDIVNGKKVYRYKAAALDCLAKAQEETPIPQKDYEDLVQKINEMEDNESQASSFTASLMAGEQYLKSRQIHEFMDKAHALACAYSALDTNFASIGLANAGKTINVTNRNVAASRLANLLGQGDLIVRSEKAALQSQDGKKKNGILMQEAAGKTGEALRRQFVGDQYYKHMKEHGEEKGFNSQEGLSLAMSGEFQRSLADLQVLDIIMGQVDRHGGNYMVEMKGDQFGAVQGIDNDFAFGLNEEAKAVGANSKDILDEQGKMAIPFMSKRLMESILAVSEEQLRFTLADVLEPAEINACWKRISKLQLAILLDQKDFETNGGTSRYLEDNEWGKETLQGFLQGDEGGNKSYIASFARKQATDFDVKQVKLQERKEQAEQYWNDWGAEFNFTDPAKTVEVLSVFTAGSKRAERALKYIIQSGLLNEWCEEKGSDDRRTAFEFSKLPVEIRTAIEQKMDNPKILDKLNEID